MSSRYNALLLGTAIGDALGAPISDAEAKEMILTESTPIGFRPVPKEYTWHAGLHLGGVTDETMLSLAVAKTVCAMTTTTTRNSNSAEEYCAKLESAQRALLTEDGCGVIGLGKATKAILLGSSSSTSNSSTGNGVVIKLAPLALSLLVGETYDASFIHDVLETFTKFTHTSPQALAATTIHFNFWREMVVSASANVPLHTLTPSNRQEMLRRVARASYDNDNGYSTELFGNVFRAVEVHASSPSSSIRDGIHVLAQMYYSEGWDSFSALHTLAVVYYVFAVYPNPSDDDDEDVLLRVIWDVATHPDVNRDACGSLVGGIIGYIFFHHSRSSSVEVLEKQLVDGFTGQLLAE
eukprot:PhF_6_TR2563/c0_g1_i1/m.4342